MFSISVVVPTSGRENFLNRLLKSIKNQNLGELKVEVVLVYNGIGSKKMNLLESLQLPGRELKLAHANRNAARNLGLKNSTGEIIYFLDDDCILTDPQHLNKVYNLHHKRQDLSIISGLYKHNAKQALGDQVYNASVEVWSAVNSYRLAPAGNISIKNRGTIIFDPSPDLVDGGEEAQFFALARNLKLKTLVSRKMDVEHHPAGGFFRLYRKAFYHGRAKQKAIGSSIFKSLSITIKRTPASCWPFLIVYGMVDFIGQLFGPKNVYQNLKAM